MNAVYISDVCSSYLALDFQREACKKFCDKNNIVNYVIIENDLQKLLDNSQMYLHIAIYTLACLGDDFCEVYSIVEKIMNKKIKLISISDPVDLDENIDKAANKFILNSSIAFAVHQNEIWKELKL